METELLFRENGQIYVACPYCDAVHQHGDMGFEDVSGNFYSSHCSQGEYKVVGVFDFKAARAALRLRARDIRRKRAARAKARETKET